MKRIIILLFIISTLSVLSYSQGYINLTKNKAKEKFEKIKNRNKSLNIITKEINSTLIFLIRDSTVQNFDLYLYFDKKGKCYKERNILTCDSCYQIFINDILSNKYYRWTKIDSTTFFARFPYRLVLKTKADKAFSFEITRSEINGEDYRKAVRKSLHNN
ncbi:MAG: hypothetical protein JST29_08610 [Bacteroidetes bacterium]|nr:hypothetical protein [Bacteroidota bacterium]MBS1592488.1 hypothetical protein [Bacteroidota bacterium]